MIDDFEVPEDPGLRLVVAGREWRALVDAEGEVARLSGYRHLTSPMRQDMHRHAERAHQARLRLHKLLAP